MSMETIIDRLNEYSAQHQSHGGICAEAADYIKELKKRAEAAERERDEVASLCGKLVALCEQPQEWRQKLFRRHMGPMIGDYMGSGYPFVDAFDRIYTDFEEKASDVAHKAVRESAEQALKERGENG